MTLLQWIRFGWLHEKMLRLGYCPKHGLPFHEGYERYQECQTCIRERMDNRLAYEKLRAEKKVKDAMAAYSEMRSLVNGKAGNRND